MNNQRLSTCGVSALVLMLVGCGIAPKKDLAIAQLSASLQRLKADAHVSEFALAEVNAAERSVEAANNTSSQDLRTHKIYLASRQIAIARAVSDQRNSESHYSQLDRERDKLLLEISLLETKFARLEAEKARLQSIAQAEEADRAKKESAEMKMEAVRQGVLADQAIAEAQAAKRLAEAQALEANVARQEALLAIAAAESLKRQLELLQARQTDEGLMLTLGDVSFEFGASALTGSARINLQEVVSFLQEYKDSPLRIEGHTDSKGGEAYNQQLSEKRAQSVADSLVKDGIDQTRITVVGLGEAYPVANNTTEKGRSDNRRVNIILVGVH